MSTETMAGMTIKSKENKMPDMPRISRSWHKICRLISAALSSAVL